MTLRRARVRVPCSTSNLGAGFDCLGLALDRYLDAEFTPADHDLAVHREGTASLVSDNRDYVRDLFQAELARLGNAPARGTLRLNSNIPLGRGLGSSAAAVVAGLLLAHAARGVAQPDKAELLGFAEAREGHPDNVAPALYGGLIGVARDTAGKAQAFPLPLSDQIGFAYAAPDVEVSTPLARRALPTQVPYVVAARALGRTAALLQGLAQADARLLRLGFADELHVPYRLPLIPRAQEAIAAARAAGAWAVTISGSGSGLIAVCTRGTEGTIASVMSGALHDAKARNGPVSFAARPDMLGASIEIEA